jgi:hypothetical protein
VYFEIVGDIQGVETIVVGGRIRDIKRLRDGGENSKAVHR